MDTLKETVQRVLEAYAGPAANGDVYLTISPDAQTFTLTAVGTLQGKRFINTGIMLRVEQDHILVLRDQTDKPVVDALVQAGIPKQHIILIYANEALPELA
jgi:hypothetical protein